MFSGSGGTAYTNTLPWLRMRLGEGQPGTLDMGTDSFGKGSDPLGDVREGLGQGVGGARCVGTRTSTPFETQLFYTFNSKPLACH